MVAEKDGLVVGVAMLTAEGTVALCYVVAEVRYTGIGKAMLFALDAEAKNRKMNSVELGSTKTAYNFYVRNGYVATGKEESAFGLTARGMRKSM